MVAVTTKPAAYSDAVGIGHLRDEDAAWLEARGLDIEVCLRMGVESANAKDGRWIVIPYRKGGVVVNRKFRRIDKKDFRQDKGAVQCWWNIDTITDPTLADQPLIVTEGELDAMAAMSAGFVRVVSVPGGAPQSPSESNAKYSFVAETLDVLRPVREIVLAVDGDGPGSALLHDLAVRLGRGRCKYLSYGPGVKDLNDVLLGYGPAAVTSLIATAKWCHVPGLFRMSELPPAPEAQPHSTMIHGLADHFNVRKGDFSVFTGIPGSGKSTFVNDLCCRMARHHGWSTVFASFEQHPQLDHRRALRTWHAGEPEPGLSRAQIEDADAWVDRHFSFVIPSEDEDSTMEWLLDKFAAAVIRYGADICVIDPWNEMDHSRPKEQTLTEYVGRAIRDLKKFARTFNVHMIVVAHPTKIMRDKDGKLPMPTLYDISDCYSEDTEALTRRGWLRHADIALDDEVMCFDPATKGLAWHRPSRVVRHDFDGEMLNFRGYGYDLLVSPNHRMVVKPAWVEPVGTQVETGIGRPVRWPKNIWSFVEARDLAATRAAFRLPKAGNPLDGDYPDRLVIDGRDFPAVEFLELVGWWIAEGSTASSGVTLCQAVGAGAERIDTLVAACGLEATRAVREDPRGFQPMVTWYFGAKTCPEIVRWLRDKGGIGAANKRVPYPIFALHPYLKVAFLNGYIAGDGHRPAARAGITATTTSRLLFDDLQRLAVELGIPVCGHIRKMANEAHSPSWHINIGTDLRGEVTLRPARNMKAVPYKGEIWCLTVPTGAYVVRRNGKVAISGNSAHWFNKPDAGLILHPCHDNETDTDYTALKVAKSRYHDQIGRPGTVRLQYNKWTARFQGVD